MKLTVAWRWIPVEFILIHFDMLAHCLHESYGDLPKSDGRSNESHERLMIVRATEQGLHVIPVFPAFPVVVRVTFPAELQGSERVWRDRRSA